MRASSGSTQMEIGVFVVNGGPSYVSADLMDGLAQAAEELGYDSICVYDHVVIPEQPKDAHPYGGASHFSRETFEIYYEPLTALAYLAGRTQRVKLVTSALIAPYRPALLVAKMLASLDALSRGRLILGIGVGWSQAEFEALGMPFHQRGKLTDECIRIWKTVWTEERPSFKGDFYSFDPVFANPKPVQKPHPPLWIGGHSRAAMRRAVRVGDGWHATRMTLDELRVALGELREVASEAGREFDELTIALKLNLRLGASAVAAADLAGSPEAIVERLRAYQALGVNHVLLDVRTDGRLATMRSALESFASAVRPRVAG